MRYGLVLAISAVALVGSAASAEARFRLRLSTSHAATPKLSAPTLSSAAAPSLSGHIGRRLAVGALAGAAGVRTAEALPPGEVGDSLFPSQPAAPVVAPVKAESAPWCPTGKLAGSGAGFCIIN